MWSTEGYYTEINTAGNKYGTGIQCALKFKTVGETIQWCLTSKIYKRSEPADLRILYVEKILRGEEIMRILLYHKTK